MAMRMRSTLRRTPVTVAVGAVAAVAVFGAVTAVGSSSTEATTSERTVTVSRGVVQSTVSGSGNLAPANQVDLSFGTSGQITKIYVKSGQHVHAGQLLAKLDPTSAKVTLAQAQADLETAQDTLDNVDSSSSSSTTTTEASAEASVKAAQLAVDDATKALASTKLRAPYAGTIASIDADVGDSVGSSSSSSSGSSGDSSTSSASSSDSSTSSDSSRGSGVMTLAQLSRYKMSVSLSESDVGKVKVGQTATVTVNAASDEEFSARVTNVGVLSSSSSSTSSSSSSTAVSYPVTLTLKQTGKAGMSATADIVVSQSSGLSVPTQALQGSTVTVESNGKRMTRQVQTGVAGDSSTQIVSGLREGEKVVVTSTSASAGSSASGSTSARGSSTGTGRGATGGLSDGLSGGGRTGGLPSGGPPGAGG
jgi:macrolide-specific efflux system membrane fusion protein